MKFTMKLHKKFDKEAIKFENIQYKDVTNIKEYTMLDKKIDQLINNGKGSYIDTLNQRRIDIQNMILEAEKEKERSMIINLAIIIAFLGIYFNFIASFIDSLILGICGEVLKWTIIIVMGSWVLHRATSILEFRSKKCAFYMTIGKILDHKTFLWSIESKNRKRV